jgi:hypothetical protein
MSAKEVCTMAMAVKYKKEIINLTKGLPENKLKELIDFAEFLKAKKEDTVFMQVGDSAAYIRKLRTAEAKRVKTGKRFIEELMEWQKLRS